MEYTNLDTLHFDHKILSGDKMEVLKTDIFYGITIYRRNGSTEIHRYTIDPNDENKLFAFKLFDSIKEHEERDKMIAHLVYYSYGTDTQIARYMGVSDRIICSLREAWFLLAYVPKPNTPTALDIN